MVADRVVAFGMLGFAVDLTWEVGSDVILLVFDSGDVSGDFSGVVSGDVSGDVTGVVSGLFSVVISGFFSVVISVVISVFVVVSTVFSFFSVFSVFTSVGITIFTFLSGAFFCSLKTSLSIFPNKFLKENPLDFSVTSCSEGISGTVVAFVGFLLVRLSISNSAVVT